MLTIALPKGRIAQETLQMFEAIFNKEFIFDDRKLELVIDEFKFLLVRNQDVPTYVQHQAADIGVVGLDVIEEKELDLIKLLDLNIGRCKVAIGIKAGQPLDLSKPSIKVATKMTNITKKYFAKKAIGAEVIKLYGSIELAPIVGLSDIIVDIVETGTTMKQNGLEVSDTIMESSAYLIANKHSYYSKKSEILTLHKKLEDLVNSYK
ncbi:MAG: ATP phosphoribosyltransferase [Campylobacterota bacterium]